MDVREKGRQVDALEDVGKQEEAKLTDSLIFNIIKKMELKIAMENKYDSERVPFIRQMP